MKIFVCRICHEVYIGPGIPPTCPYCGVNQKYFALPQVWEDQNNVELSEVSRKNLETALLLELSNANFYLFASLNLENKILSKMFKGLHKVEKEHATIFQKLLKNDSLGADSESFPSEEVACLYESSAREEKAVAFYAKALSEAKEDRIKEVFEAIMNTEKDHIALDAEMLSKFAQNEKIV
jgi:rubrerythrin